MKNSKRFLIFLMIRMLGSSVCFADHQLTHMCAYSNESAVKFRNKVIKNTTIKHPGISFDWPIDLCEFWISSLYGLRKNPLGGYRMHNGVDLAALKGTTVKSVADGTVVSVCSDISGYGNVVEINHKKGFVGRYAHLHTMDVKQGSKVKKGQKIGTVGCTGNVRGKDPSHLHFELIKHDKRVDPLGYLYSAEISYKNLKK